MSCCCNHVGVNVIASTSVTTPDAATVTLTADGALPVGVCFKLYIPQSFLVNITTGLVSLTDGTTTFALFDQCADQVRWDQLVRKGLYCSDFSNICLTCSVRSVDATARVLVESRLPASTYMPAATV